MIKEITSLCSQLAYTYSANRRASYPFTIIFTSLNGRTYERLEALGDASYKRWTSANWYSAGFEKFIEYLPSHVDAKIFESSNDADHCDHSNNVGVPLGEDDIRGRRLPKSSLVYLTADTGDELTEIKPDETYIIGGICDHNRYKAS